jgi:ADP-ribose pyrophosphatase
MSEHQNDYPDRPRVAVGAIVFKDDEILLVHRAQPPSQDIWAIPGGSVEIGESLQEAAEREIMEETGVTIRAGEPIFTFDYIERDDDGRVRFHYVIVDVSAEYISGEPCAGDDANDARWVSSQAIAKLKVSPMTRRLLNTEYNFEEIRR